FNSFYHSGLILLAVLLSTAGVLLGIMITGRTFQVIMTGVGIISLAGIVVNNNIVLIDTYARLKESGMEAYEAIVQTVAQRLRPVMLTTLTTIIGLLPMVFMVNIDFAGRKVEIGAPYGAFWVDLAIALSFGLLFATVLTLLLTPCMLALRVKFSKKYRESNLKPLSSKAPQPAE
ncbi:MAG: efflux RND transporter permease subunit, partial [Emcibacteraceae bacterium]|nr:efflux RND transporter permease subunit [Emcibacteraceae bacterium]